jgi:hypothetical protein
VSCLPLRVAGRDHQLNPEVGQVDGSEDFEHLAQDANSREQHTQSQQAAQ